MLKRIGMRGGRLAAALLAASALTLTLLATGIMAADPARPRLGAEPGLV